MPGSLIVSINKAPFEKSVESKAAKGANPSGQLILSTASGMKWMIHSGCSDKCELGSTRIYEDYRYAGCFSGTLVDRKSIPWRPILDGLVSGGDDTLKTLHANHAIMVYDKVEQEVFLATDKFGQHPLYAGILEGCFFASTSLLTFLHILKNPELDPSWLHDFFFFNYPLNTTSVLNGVQRIGPGRVIRMDLRSSKPEMRRYAPQLERRPTALSMREAQVLALEAFSERFPRYYDNIVPGGCGVGVTSGFDARIVASYMPDGLAAHLYTYGIDGCSDMVNGKKVANKLGLKHHAFAFSSINKTELQELAADTIYYSGGNLNALRSTLARVYQHLSGAGLGIILTGVSSGHFFRGIFSSPQVLSATTVELIRNPSYIPDPFYKELFLDKDALLDSFEMKRRYLQENLGWASMSVEERHMSFMHYEQAPKYFGGELAFAECFGHMRSPFWDARIRELSYEIPLSTLHNSIFLGRKSPPWMSKAMLGYILSRGRLKHLDVDGMPPKYWATGTKLGYYTGKLLHRGPEKITKKLFPKSTNDLPLEDWSTWVKKAFLPNLQSTIKDSSLARYINPRAMDNILASDVTNAESLHWTGKLLTASMVTDMVEKYTTSF